MLGTSSGDSPVAADGRLTEEDGYRALREHLVDKARVARERYGPSVNADGMRRLLLDGEIVRFPVRIAFDAEPLMPGEFGWAQPAPEGPKGGFTLWLHPHFEGRPELLPWLAAYHVPSINYLDVATHEEAELFGATLLGVDVDFYYERLCELVDGLPGPPAPPLTPEIAQLLTPDPIPTQGGCGSGGCGCSSAS